MRAAIPLETNSSSAKVYKRFARAPFLAIADTDTKAVTIVENVFATDTKGVGDKVLTMLISEHRIDCCIAFELGLKIQKLVAESDIRQVILHSDNQTLEDILKMLHIIN